MASHLSSRSELLAPRSVARGSHLGIHLCNTGYTLKAAWTPAKHGIEGGVEMDTECTRTSSPSIRSSVH